MSAGWHLPTPYNQVVDSVVILHCLRSQKEILEHRILVLYTNSGLNTCTLRMYLFLPIFLKGTHVWLEMFSSLEFSKWFCRFSQLFSVGAVYILPGFVDWDRKCIVFHCRTVCWSFSSFLSVGVCPTGLIPASSPNNAHLKFGLTVTKLHWCWHFSPCQHWDLCPILTL